MDTLFAVGFFTDGLLRTNGHLAKVVVRAVVDVEIHIALDARKTTDISMLPEFPLALILKRINVIVCYPVWVLVKD